MWLSIIWPFFISGPIDKSSVAEVLKFCFANFFQLLAEILRKWSQESVGLGGEEKVMKKSSANQAQRPFHYIRYFTLVENQSPKSYFTNLKTFSKIGFWIFLAEKLIWIFKPNISKNKNETLEVDFETLCGWVSIWTIYPGSKLSVAGSPSIEGNSRFLMDNPNIKTWMSLLVEYSKVLAPTLLLTTQAQVLSFDSDFNSIRTIVGNPCQRRPSSQCSSRWGKVF